MSSHRHSPSPRDDYLDAARACILDVGWRRTTLTEVARRAGVSRMTIYRTWSDMPELMRDLMTREWGTLTGLALPQGSPTPDAVADLSVGVVTTLRDNELFVRILELDPELVLPYLFARRGRTQDQILEGLTALVRAGQAAGTLRAGDPVTIARGIVLTCHGFVFSAQTMLDRPEDGAEDGAAGGDADGDRLDDLTAELHLTIRRLLLPEDR